MGNRKPPSIHFYSHTHAGPGLAIRVICQTDAYLREDFSVTNTLLAHIVDYHHCSQTPSPMVNLIEQFASPSEKEILLRITKECILSATLLPIFSVGVQVSNAGHFVCHPISSYLLIPSLSNLSFSPFMFSSFYHPFSSSSSSSFFSLSFLCVPVFLSYPTLSSLVFILFLSHPLLFPSPSRLPHLVFPLSIQTLLLHVLVFLFHLASPLSQGDGRSYNYVAALSSDDEIPWDEIMTLAKLIPRVCHNINRYSTPMYITYDKVYHKYTISVYITYGAVHHKYVHCIWYSIPKCVHYIW